MIIQRPVIVTDVYPDDRLSTGEENLDKRIDALIAAVEYRLRKFSLNETFRYCVHLNLFVSVSEDPRIELRDQIGLVHLLFPKNAIPRIHQAFERNQGPLPPTVFSRGQALELMRWILFCCPEKGKYTNPIQSQRSRSDFSQALLMSGELATLQVEDANLVNEDEIAKRTRLLAAVRRLALQSVQTGQLIRVFGRGKTIFFEFLPEQFPDFTQEFEDKNGLSLEEYYSCLTLVMSSYLDVELKQGTHERHLIRLSKIEETLPHMFNAFVSYMNIEAQTIAMLRAALWEDGSITRSTTLRPLRERPVIKLDGDVAMVLDPAVHIGKAMIGPLFMIDTPFQQRLGYFGKAFERYAQNILRIMHPGGEPRLLRGDDLKITGRQEEEIADACLIDGENLLIFEMKAVFIPDDTVFGPDSAEYVKALREKYGKEGRVADQLAKAVNRLTAGQWTLPEHNMEDVRRIYPILIAYDSYLDLPGHYWLGSTDFRAALKPAGNLSGSMLVMTKGKWEIAPLTILTIDVLEDLEASIANFTLAQLLSDYIVYCDANFRDVNDDLSLSEFIRRSEYAAKMDYRGTVASKALEIFSESQRMLLT